MPDAPKQPEPSGALKAIGEGSAALIAFGFVCGWSYLTSYYQTFGLNTLKLDISVPVVATTGLYAMVADESWLAGGLALVVVAGLILIEFVRPRRGILSISAFVVLMASMTAGFSAGHAAANEDKGARSIRLPNVSFAVSAKPEEAPPDCVDVKTYGSMDCKLLLHTDAIYYFFEPVPDTNGGNINLYALSESQILGVHVQHALRQ